MAAPSEEKLICDQINLEALTVNQVKSFKALADGKDVFIGTKTGSGIFVYSLIFAWTWVHPQFLGDVCVLIVVFAVVFFCFLLGLCSLSCARCYLCFWVVHF